MHIDLTKPEETTAVSQAASYRLYQAGMVALVSSLVYFYWSTRGNLDLAQFLALVTIFITSLPALRWAKNRSTWFPAFEISMLTCIAFYAVPLFKNAEELAGYTADNRMQASLTVLIYAVCANFGFSSARFRPQPSAWAVVSLLPSAAIRWIPTGMFLNVLYAYFSVFENIIPTNITGTVRALSFGIGIMSTFILARLWGLNQLNRQQITLFLCGLIAYLLMTFASLYLIGGISLLALAFISFASARRKVPWIMIAIVGSVIALLHLGKPQMRKIYWDPETNESKGAPVTTLLDIPMFYSEWVGYSMQAVHESEANPEQGPTSIFDRASLIQMICLSVAEVPASKPYLMGESYIDIPAQVIPRFLWENKPSSLLANIRLAIYFNLVDPSSAFSYSIAFGPLAEAYINFGYFGVALLGLFLGVGFKRVSLLSDGAPQFSALGIFMILLTAWSFQAEQVMATWLSSLFQACVICIGLPLIYKKLTTG